MKSEILAKTNTSLECTVCSEIMHVPFVLACGHSFCYECLNAWFENKVNCPTCRLDLEQVPVVNIHLKDISKFLTEIIIESTEDIDEKKRLIKHRDTAYETYEYDSRHKRLFGEAFNSSITLIDRSDGVPRCGNCHWEAHGSVCLHCGSRIRIPRDDGYYDSDGGEAYNEDDEEIALYGRDDDNRYDSEDSFIDSRDITTINMDEDNLEDVLSTGSGHSLHDDWSGFDDQINISANESDSDDLNRAIEDFNHLDPEIFSDDEPINDDSNRRRRTRVVNISDSEDE